MEVAKGFKNTDFQKLDLSDPDSTDWNTAIDIFIKRIEPRYLEPIRILIAEDSKLDVRERRYGFTITAIMCLLIETLYCFRKGILDNTGNAVITFREFLTESNSFKDHFDEESASAFYNHIRNGILHQAETKEKSRIRDVGPLVRKIKGSIAINRTEFFNLLENEFHSYIDQLADTSNAELRAAFIKKMNHVCS
ncbi:MAG: hypothetical protein Tsb0034_08490 [Ekhidna sp.]